MIILQTLTNCSAQEMADAFNLAFSDYIIPISLTAEQMQDKIIGEDIDLTLSVGAFSQNKLVGFILHGCRTIDGQKIAYNAGTGVFPNHRGNRLTARMYEYIIPIFRLMQIDAVELEVITDNTIALKTYQQIGFAITRSFNCYKGVIHAKPKTTGYIVEEATQIDEQVLKQFHDFEPRWQNALATYEKLKQNHIVLAAYDNHEVVGYLIWNAKSNRVQQVAVHKSYRRKGIATQLFDVLAKRYSNSISINNIDDRSAATNHFLQNIGLTVFIRQYEMRYVIPV